ncbi:ABC-2 type transporter-domain-containing protein [Zychaea mexicana]|uniref:ABC-2 type transporter-domain-containing protein n=1 Tax=Zychaea mexicana TaxID=64656 RepID=UPI0022FDDF00|nr:ABC-2 type transporter-domain-containing protein [Zychaea mexicana]KAI9499301.1 ABC-2 type transporter-domain-containing protein [Zychaea mexicana]
MDKEKAQISQQYRQQRSNNDDKTSVETVLEPIGSKGSYGEPNANIVDVDAAIGEYHELKRGLSRISRKSTNASKVEEGVVTQEEFSLDDFLHGMNNDAQEAGHVPKHLGLVFRDLTVEGLGADAHTIRTNLSDLMAALQFWKVFGIGKKTSKKTILRGLDGFCKDGEMLLVLGRPGAGCTSLLKVLANMRGSFTKVDGQVSYGGIDHETFGKYYRGQAIYNEEEDQHYPTTRQTLQFALRCKTPGTRLPDETSKDFVEKIIYLLGNMLGLTRQMPTIVGNAFVRGLSGGERKRLSIAEVMTTQSSINCWDCSTRGLDAASALDYVRSLRIMTDVFKKTTISTLYQASNSIYSLYDKVLLLDDGYCIYFGPADEAKAYFENLGFYCPPRKSIPDFLTGLCNPVEREIKPGFENTAPQHASEFQARYYESTIHKRLMAELENYEQLIERNNPSETFKNAVVAEHQKGALKKSPYTASFWQQVMALTVRQYHLLIKDHHGNFSRYGTIFVQGLISASCFYKMPMTAAGAFSRGGALFFALLFNSLISQTEMVNYLTGKPILAKQKHFAMFQPSAFYIAQVIMDVPYAIVQVVIFALCSYFLMGLNLDAGHWFGYCLILFFLNMMMNGFFRLFGAICKNFYLGTEISGIFLVAMMTYTGYVIPYKTMHPWLYWIYWINPMGYAYKALIINEMRGQVYSCEGEGNSIPFGPGYEAWANKVCTMKGAVPGENVVRGDDYLREALSYEPSQQWAPYFVAVVAFFLFFTVVIAGIMEFSDAMKGGSITKLYHPGKAPKSRTDEEEDERRKKQQEVTNNMEGLATGTTFSWHHIHYEVPFKGGPLHLLNDISGIVKPGHLTALMGSSGAGKTTLLDVLAKRKTIGKVDGRVYLNNEALMSDFERITGYCEQMDIHQPAVTVREAMRFSAYLRQNENVPKAEKDEYVEQILTLLEMEDIADAQIGVLEEGTGISVEERKRLTIGMELVAKPKLLFLDEPTSGLDAQSSFNIVRFIRKLADCGWPVLCTIHQPSSILFEHFDHLLLLVRGGKTAYYGEIGKDARIMIDYFESNGGPTCSPDANPAEYILEVVGAGTAGKATRDWAEIWTNSPQAQSLEEELEDIHQVAEEHPKRESLAYATSFWTQFWLVYKRINIAYWRSPEYNIGRFITLEGIALITGFTYWKMSYTTSDMQNRLFFLLSTFIMAVLLIILSQPKFMTERLYFRREYASRYYGWVPFSIASILVEIPYILVICALYMCGFYWTAGLVNTSEACGYFYLMFVFFVCWAVSLGFVIAAFSEHATMASVINPLFISMLILFAGMMQSPSAMPHFWSSWMYWLDPFHYYLEGLATNEMRDLPVECKELDVATFYPPEGQTCGEYSANFFANGATGYIVNENATDICEYCSYKSGQEFYSSLYQWDAGNKWRNLGIMICYFIFNVFVFVILCFFKRKARR